MKITSLVLALLIGTVFWGGWALVAALGAGCVPQLLDLRDTISSDLAFTAWVMLALCLHARAEKAPALLAAPSWATSSRPTRRLTSTPS